MESPIRLLRERAGLTQSEFGRLCGMKQSRLSSYECGARQLPVEAARAMQPVLRERGVYTTLDDFYPPAETRPAVAASAVSGETAAAGNTRTGRV